MGRAFISASLRPLEGSHAVGAVAGRCLAGAHFGGVEPTVGVRGILAIKVRHFVRVVVVVLSTLTSRGVTLGAS